MAFLPDNSGSTVRIALSVEAVLVKDEPSFNLEIVKGWIMATNRGIQATMEPVDKTPRTDRGRKTLRAILDAAASEFGEKGFHESSIVGITSRAGVALGSFYTYFDSKDAIFRALVRDMSAQVSAHAAAALRGAGDPLSREAAVFRAFLEFTRGHKEIYRIIDEAEVADPEGHRLHYEDAAARILARLRDGAAQGAFRSDLEEAHAWAIMGMNVFLGLRFGVWSDSEDAGHIASVAQDFVAKGLGR